jgi:6-methylsalicylate decarboxylase
LAGVTHVDVHQHLWSEPLVAALARRDRPPCIRRRGGAWTLTLAGEPPCELDLDSEAPERRAALVEADGLDRALLCLSSPLGIETLPADEAHELLEAYATGALGLGDRFGAWGGVALRDPDPRQVDRLLDEGFVGVSLPAGALATPAALLAAGPLLERLERRGAPLLVHPGAAQPVGRVPSWWPGLTDYVGSLNAAWHAFVARGRSDHPRLRVVFAALAGLAPLHLERLGARGGPAEAARDDGLLFYDTSSYGPLALRAVAAAVGVGQLVLGSDRPVVEPGTWPDDGLLGRARSCVAGGNVARLLGAVPA